jgi:pilus assembly protein CpaE
MSNNNLLNVLLVEDNALSAHLTKTMLGRADNCGFEVRIAESLMGALDHLGAHTFDVILLDLTLPDSEGLGTLTTIRVHAPQVPVLVLTASDDEALASAALDHGAQDYIIKGTFDGNSLGRSLLYAVKRHRQAMENTVTEANTPRAQVVGVLGAKGGVGGTTLAMHLALAIRGQTDQKVLLVDLDVNGGSLGFLMKVDSPYSVLDASLNLHRLDTALWQSLVWQHSSGLSVLQSPGSVHYGEELLGERVRHLLRLAQTRYSWIVIDMGRFSELSMSLVSETSQLLLVSSPEIPSLYEAKKITQKLHEMGQTTDKTTLVFNRSSRADLDVPAIQKTFGMPVSVLLPDATRDLHEAYAEGKLLPAGSALNKLIAKLASDVTGATLGQPRTPRRGFFGVLRSA